MPNADVTFLQAEFPLTKSYRLRDDGSIDKSNYPNAWAFTSHTHAIDGIQGLHSHLVSYAKTGHCLLKGVTAREIKNARRAGLTSSEDATNWLCFDLDKVGLNSPQQFLALIGADDVSYVVQYSSSYGIEDSRNKRLLDSRLSCHIFMWLTEPVSAPLIKQWLIQLNFEHQVLTRELALTMSKNALHFGLDITTCQNDKLLYIAPPKLPKELKDTLGTKRIEFVKGRKAAFALDTAAVNTVSQNRGLIDAKVNELRVQSGLEPRKKSLFKIDAKLNVEYLKNPDPATVTGRKVDRGFVYLNLNGGDSWGYYFPEGQPEVLHNFKGEPPYLLKEICPSFYASYMAELAQAKHLLRKETVLGEEQERAANRHYLAFRDFNTGGYWNGWYDRETDALVLKPAKSEKQLRDFLAQYDLELGEYVPDWSIEFDPHSAVTVDLDNRKINRYKPSRFEYLELREPGAFPTIMKVMAHALGINGSDDPIDDPLCVHFINWLAFIVQHKRPSTTCWVLHGNQGTGKGIMFNHVLRPILGEDNTTTKRTEEFEGQFNGWMENNLLALVDEVHMSQLLKAKLINAKLKNWIGEPSISIRDLYQPARMAKNFNNFVFASNETDAVIIDSSDRRFNVANFQPNKLIITEAEIERIATELEEFYLLLAQWPIDELAVRTPLQTEARREMMEISKASVDVISEHLRAGNLYFFFDQLPDDPDNLNGIQVFQYELYKQVLTDWLDDIEAGRSAVTRDQLQRVMEYCIGDVPKTPHKFSSYMKHHRIQITQVFYRGKAVQGHNTVWLLHDAKDLAKLRRALGGEPEPAPTKSKRATKSKEQV